MVGPEGESRPLSSRRAVDRTSPSANRITRPGINRPRADGIPLSRIFTGERSPWIYYKYDFGDSWQHEIRLEKMLDREL
jgi:hypothetical protein